MRSLLLAALVAATLSSEPANAADVVTLKPSSPWNVDYSDDSCALRRRFGAEGSAVTMELRQFRPGHVYHLTVVSNDFKPWRSGRPRLSIDPDDGDYNHEKALLVNYANGMGGYSFKPASFQPRRSRNWTSHPS